MDLLDRLLGHDAWTTRQLLEICVTLTEEQLDREFEIGHRTLRATFHHVVSNMEVWSALMASVAVHREADRSIAGLLKRLDAASRRLADVARAVADRDGWDDRWLDVLDNPPRQKTYGAAIAHILTHSMHHRAQVLYMLRLSGLTNLPEGDVFSWELRNASSMSPPPASGLRPLPPRSGCFFRMTSQRGEKAGIGAMQNVGALPLTNAPDSWPTPNGQWPVPLWCGPIPDSLQCCRECAGWSQR